MKKILLCVVVVIGLVMGGSLPSTHASSKNSRIVAQSQFLNQNGNLLFTTVYTPPSEGDFRVSIYVSGLTGTGSVGVTWTDLRSSRTDSPSTSNAFSSLTDVIHSASSQPIQIEVLNSSTAYDVYVTIEEL